jgi:hypothetical protein
MRINELRCISLLSTGLRFLFIFAICTLIRTTVSAQDNSPYTRYGLGDLVPSTNVSTRGMGSIAAGYNDILSINFNNPASYGSFQVYKEATAKKTSSGRALLDIGINVENRTLKEPNAIGKFTSSNLLFSHVQVGIPLRPNWGLSFGLRPVTRVSYKIMSNELLRDAQTNQPIDSSSTLNTGDGGAYLASIGTGWRIALGANQSISFGINGGYLFGKKDYSSRRSIFNDSLRYNSGNYQTKTTYGSIYGNAGLQYSVNLKKDVYLTIGAYGNWKQNLKARQDIIRETFYYDQSQGNLRLDSVSDQKDIRGTIVYPSSYTAGFVLQRYLNLSEKKTGWLIGVDFSQGKWSEYRFYGQKDPTVQDKWELRAGAELKPFPKENYFSNVAYRAGLFIGEDYIIVDKKLPLLGISLGMGLPIRNFSRVQGQYTIVNFSAEFIKRGNNDNLLKENLFRLSVGFSLSDIWFQKRKYE